MEPKRLSLPVIKGVGVGVFRDGCESGVGVGVEMVVLVWVWVGYGCEDGVVRVWMWV